MKRKQGERQMNATVPRLNLVGNSPSKIKTKNKKADRYKAIPFHKMTEKDKRESMEAMRDDEEVSSAFLKTAKRLPSIYGKVILDRNNPDHVNWAEGYENK
ncbi:hypothetical protein [Paenibacillus aceti]|uniref:Uncharacterized protein n=1 Tax=Paenibacillus aceti TaxID=1820010 RepID=A0ABQ1W540_9BACL|nr:hypothetical protein [Paenibacillus aceti]GGG15489.1 hypothetical protein GCM10010913_41760 [Paenibacillus aceti]